MDIIISGILLKQEKNIKALFFNSTITSKNEKKEFQFIFNLN